MAEDKNNQRSQQIRESVNDSSNRNISTNYSEHVKNNTVTTTQKAPENPFRDDGKKKDD